MKIAAPSAKNVLALLRTTAAASATDTGILKKKKKKNTWFWKYGFRNLEWRNEWYNENYTSSWRF